MTHQIVCLLPMTVFTNPVSFRRSRWLSGEEESLQIGCHSDAPEGYRERRNPFKSGVIPTLP
ncbi:MAG TPA: hypothetical protein PLK12_17515, partial [Prolixibacteraceae bacterium]|nr:hypothetical protein [Prolixibacteraceae bacterium]